jgi:hypothetical protein
MLVRGFVASRVDGEEVVATEFHEGDMVFTLDNCFHHHTKELLKCFQNDDGKIFEMQKKLVYVGIDEDSLRLRKGLVRPSTSFDCVEHMHILTAQDFSSTITHVRRKHYTGSNISNKMGDVMLPGYDTLWSLPCRVKQDIHGQFRVACGGPTVGEEVGTGVKRKTGATIEPVFWRSRPLKFYDSLISDYALSAIVDLTAADGTLMAHCAKERIPYFGFCLSERHAQLLKTRVVQQVLESFFTAGERECDLELAAMMTPAAQASAAGAGAAGAAAGSMPNALKDFQDKLKQFKLKADGSATGTEAADDDDDTAPKRPRGKAAVMKEEPDSPDM